MNATYLLVGAIVGVAILAMVFKQQNRYQGDWQVQGNALSFGMENFDGPSDPEVVDTDEHTVDTDDTEHMTQDGEQITKWTPELEAEKKALQAKLAAAPAAPAVAVPASAVPEEISENFELSEELEGFEGFEGGDMKMPYLGMEYAAI
jgi:hypothetical protein